MHDETLASHSRKSLAVTTVGLLTLLWGAAHAIVGGCFLLGGRDLLASLRDPAGGAPLLFPLLLVLADLMLMIGAILLFLGLPGILAGSGILFRKSWGRILTIVIAVPILLLGIVVLGLSAISIRGEASDGIALLLGGAEFAYGVFAIVILATNGADFARPQLDPDPFA